MPLFTQAGLGKTRSEVTLEEEQLPKQGRKTEMKYQNDLPDVSDRAGTAVVTNHGLFGLILGDRGKENNIDF